MFSSTVFRLTLWSPIIQKNIVFKMFDKVDVEAGGCADYC